MKLVRFEDGTYGVRTFWFFGWHFRDLTTDGFSWPRSSKFFRDCKATEEKARAAMARYEVIE